jgi:aminopeptidase N
VAAVHGRGFTDVDDASTPSDPYATDTAAPARRRLRNVALAYLSALEGPEAIARLTRQFDAADNMTDAQAALGLIVDFEGPERDAALQSFYDRWRNDPLVLDKWLALQATAPGEATLDRVQEMLTHPAFTIKNPNKVRALIGTFCVGNPAAFHAANGSGYLFAADQVLALDPLNPQVAARLVGCLSRWRRYDPARQGLMKAQLERIAARKELSRDVREIVSKSLAPVGQ